MKIQKLLLTSLGASLALLACSCNSHTLSRTYFDPERKQLERETDGYFETKPDGSCAYINDGIEKIWYPSGALRRELHFSDGNLTGDQIAWWPNGIVMAKNHFNDDGLVDGDQYIYDISGKLLKHYRMDNGTGIEYDFHCNGQLKIESSWKDGKLDGETKKYDETGKLISTDTYSMGVKRQ